MLLTIETSTARSSVALADPGDGSLLAAAELGRDRRHGEFVTPAIGQLLRHLGAGIEDVTAVACGTGPGLYTGLRVGLVTAATIAATHDLPCVGVVGPDAIAHGLRHVAGDVVVALDARRRELYLARYTTTVVAGGDIAQPTGDLAVVTPRTAAEQLAGRSGATLLAGDGTDAIVAAFAELDTTAPGLRLAGPAHAHPTAASLVPLAVAALRAGSAGGPEVFEPLYLRQADAKIGWDQRGRLRGGARQT